MSYLSEFQTKLLTRLIDKYESSGLSNGTRTKGSVTVKSDDPVFSKYWSRDSYKYRDDIEADIKELCDRNLITVKKSFNDEIISVSLVLSNAGEVFSLIGRISNASVEKECIKVTETLIPYYSTPVVKKYLEAMEQLLKNHKSHKKWFVSADEISLTAKMISSIECHDGDAMLRIFSKHNFSNSKMLEKNLPFILSVFNEFGDDYFSDADNLLNHYGIIRNPGFIQFFGNMVFSVNKHKIDLSEYGHVFSLSESALEHLSIHSVKAKIILTVENLTTFNSIITEMPTEVLAIYLGGFASKAQIEFIKKLKNEVPDCEWLHFSDIDVGGFRILCDLRNRTGIGFKPFMMDAAMLEKYSEECEPLSENDIRELSVMRKSSINSELFGVIDHMLSNNIKLEQESIDPNLVFDAISLSMREAH